MSTSSEYEPTARQDYGPATPSEDVYEHVLDHKVTDSMNVQSIRTPVLRAVPVSLNEGDPEPDSTNHESIIQSVNKVDKEVEYHIAEKRHSEMSVDTLANIVRIEESNCTIDNVGRIAYPILQEADDSNEGNYVENSATLIQGPLSTAIVQNVTKLPQNFTINMDAAVSNITTIQNVTQDVSGTQTLWLPTILATSTPVTDSKLEEDRPQAGVSQIIITSESYGNETTQVCRRSNIVTETSYITRPKTSKVQILSNISLPKNPIYSQQYITQTKEISPVYATQNHVYKLSTNVVTQKHLNSSVLCTKPSKSQSLIGCSTLTQSVINTSPIKNVQYSHTFTKSTNLNKTLNKVNNGANLNAMVAASSGSTQCHILSRVVSGPNKMSVHSGRKSVNTFKGSKSSQTSNQKNQSRPIKIIQQTGSAHKSEPKSWPVANVTYKNQQPTYGVVDTNSSKIIQKVGSPTNKTQPLSIQKFPAKGERLVLQSPCGPVLLSNAPISTSLPKGPHYVQSGATPNLRYVQTYGTADNQLTSVSQVTANQQLTAQILQSLSQPKIVLQTAPITHTITTLTAVPAMPAMPTEERAEIKPIINHKRIVMGDKSTLLTAVTADDLIGIEERPNLSEELRRYSYQPLAFIMMDHTYSLPAQKQPLPQPQVQLQPQPQPQVQQQPLSPVITQAPLPLPPPTTPPTPVSTMPPATLTLVSPPITTIAPMSPQKRTSPVIVSTASYDLPIAVPTSVIGTTMTSVQVPSIQMTPVPYKPQPLPPPPDDDAASVISSIDGDRKPAPDGGSDTETAPEGEEEGKTRCICDFTHDDGYMICCDRCGEWQHVDCMGIDRLNIPDAYMCELCHPRPIDRRHARNIQMRKREELSALGASDSDSSEIGRPPGQRRKRLLTVTTYTNTSGSCVTTYNSNPPSLPPVPEPTLALPKRGPKRPLKKELVRKGTKRKLSEKRVKRKKEMILNRSKYGSSLSNQSHWQDAYELAVTNHYSPELRAKIMKYSSKLGNQPNMGYALNTHLCTTVPHAGGKILIATKDLKENTPVIELRGKYMLSNQHRPQLQNTARAGSQKPGPFVFFYRLPKDNTQICIDTRTYGNEARFVRRSCKPNAELQHCIVKGTLHVYLVTIGIIQSNTEITVGHDSDGSKQPCACGNPKHCKVNGMNTPLPPRKSMDYPPQREKRSRNRCFSSSSPVSPPLVAPTTPVKEPPFIPTILAMKPEKFPIKHEYPPLSPAKPIIMSMFEEPIKVEAKEEIEEPKPEMDLTAKEEMKPENDFDEPDFCKIEKVEEKLDIIEEPPLIKIEPEIKEEPAPIEKEIEEEKPILIPNIIPPIATPKLTPPAVATKAIPPVIAPDVILPVITPNVIPPVITSKVMPPVITPEVIPPAITPEVIPPVITPEVIPPVITPEVIPPVITPKVIPPVITPKVIPPVITPNVILPVVTTNVIPPVVTPNVILPVITPNVISAVITPNLIPPVITPSVIPPIITPNVIPPVITPKVSPPVITPKVIPPVITPSVIPPVITPKVIPPVITPKTTPPIISPKSIPTKVIATRVEERRRSRYISETKFFPEMKYTPAEIKQIINNDETFSDEEKPEEKIEETQEKEDSKIEDEKPLSVLSKEVTAKSACQDRSSRSSRTTCANQDSLDDKTDDSQDKIQTTAKEKRKMTREERKMEAIMKAFERMEKAEQRKQEVKERQKRRESDPHPNAIDRDDDEEVHCVTKRRKRRKGRARTTSQSNRRRLNSADSDMLTSGDEAPPPPATPPRRDSSAAAHEPDRPHSVSEDLSLSSACLLVEAAVGSVESAFKLPKTKKTMATEWIGRSPERTPSPYRSPYRPPAAPSLESLVRVASTMIGDLGGHDALDAHDELADGASPPRTPGRDRNRPPKKSRRVTRSTPPTEVPEVTHQILPQHSAKKRWLRQAISEESDPPSTESPPNEMITPLKKRRLARESLSMEQNTIVPCTEETSPILTSEDSPVKDDPHSNRQYIVRNIMDSIYGRDRTRSDSGQGSDDQCNMDNDVLNVNIKVPHDSENIRRIIGVPTPEDEMPPELPKPDDFRSNNNNVELEESNYNKVVPMEIDTTIPQPKIQDTIDSRGDSSRVDSPNEKLNSCQSADTSGNSSPQRDEMDDIQKKIHSFHTENIMILKSRNKKPKEKRKKVNLNFDLNMVDDQISIQLRTENEKSPEINGDIHDDISNDMKCHVSPENIPLPPPVESIPLPENIPLPEEPNPMLMVLPPETIPLPEEPMKLIQATRPAAPASPVPEERPYTLDRPSVLENATLPFSSRFSSTGLFSGIFSNMSQTFTMDSSINENVPNMSIIKSAIDRTTSLDSSLFDKDSITQSDEMKSVQEILTRVNNMDSNNSVILSGVLKSSNKAALLTSPVPKPASRQFVTRSNDPRLNPPPVEKPKPIRRKLSITEYRKRKGAAADDAEGAAGRSGGASPERTESSESSGAALSPQRLDAAAAAAAVELEQRLHKELVADHLPKGVFDAQPTALERQRENLSSRLRREFGLALPEDDEARPPPDSSDGASGAARCDR